MAASADPKYRVCPACQHKIPWEQAVPIFFEMPRDCPSCNAARAEEAERAQKAEDERRTRINELDPIISPQGVRCPNCRGAPRLKEIPVNRLSEFTSADTVAILVCRDDEYDDEGCSYTRRLTAAAQHALKTAVNDALVARERDTLGVIARQFEARMIRAGISGHLTLAFPADDPRDSIRLEWDA